MKFPSEITHSLQAESVVKEGPLATHLKTVESLKSTNWLILSALQGTWRCSLARLAELNIAKPNLIAFTERGERVAHYLWVNAWVGVRAGLNGSQTAC